MWAIYEAFTAPAMNDAGDVDGNYDLRDISVHGRTAVVHFPGGRDWRMRQLGSRWLVAAFPMLPPSVSRQAPLPNLS